STVQLFQSKFQRKLFPRSDHSRRSRSASALSCRTICRRGGHCRRRGRRTYAAWPFAATLRTHGPACAHLRRCNWEMARATGRDIRYLSITPHEYRDALVQAQVPDAIIELVLSLFDTVLDGRNTPVADGVQRALGRAPRDFSEYVKLTAATGVWNA